MQLPDSAAQARRKDSTLVKALARAFQWNRMLESGEFTSISDVAQREGITFTYMARLMRLSLLAPEIVDAIMDGRQPESVTLANLMDPFPLDWKKQQMQLLQRGTSER